jgi:FkbM family methyltransferase
MQSPVHWGKRAFWREIGERLFWQHHHFTTKTEFGTVMQGNTGDRVPSAIYYFGVWEPHLTRFIRRRLQFGDVFIDVGANIGYYSLCASKLVGVTGRVVAVEASPVIYRELVANLEMNRASNVRPVHCAVSNTSGELLVYGGPPCNRGSATTVPTGNEDEVPESSVRAATLETLLTQDEIDRVRLVKIDVEGAEWAVAQGMAPIFESCRKEVEIAMEISPSRLAAQGHSAEEILNLFRVNGFHAYALENDYEMISYVPPVESRPILRVDRVTEHTDIIFSRLDQAQL